jgi:hypothetical protein
MVIYINIYTHTYIFPFIIYLYNQMSDGRLNDEMPNSVEVNVLKRKTPTSPAVPKKKIFIEALTFEGEKEGYIYVPGNGYYLNGMTTDLTDTVVKHPKRRKTSVVVSYNPHDVISPGAGLDTYQTRVLKLVREGKNIFITGNAGTGKSLVLKHIIQDCKNKKKRVAVTAPTGIAACNINGVTLHRFFGIGIPKWPKDFNKMWGVKQRIQDVNVLIVDEISMCSGEMLDYIESTMRDIRNSKLPFGGVQLIVSGDFLQLVCTYSNLSYL